MLDLLLIAVLGFLGSFGHCVGMCGPLTVAFSLPREQQNSTWQQQLYFHGLLNLGRLVSYALVGAAIGALGSVLIASGHMAGVDSGLRRSLALMTGVLLIWFGLHQVKPELLPKIPLLHPIQGDLHQRLSHAMMRLSTGAHWWTPALLGVTWGLMPCGFLYAAQIKAAETGTLWMGSATMLAFGLGTLPTMLGVGVATSLVSRDRRSQLFRLGGWVTIAIGSLTLLRTGNMMVDYTGHAALLCLVFALIARPISQIWSQPLRYRRALGVGAFVLALAHAAHMLEHTLDWNFRALSFMLPAHQVAIWIGLIALVLLTPAALTSFDFMMNSLGKRWRLIHLLSIPALLLGAAHVAIIGSHYLGGLEWTMAGRVRAGLLGALVLVVLLVRSRPIWSLLSLEKFYTSPLQPK